MEVKTIFDLGELFEQVQLQKVFPDNKTFVDCIPKNKLSVILDRYESEKNDKNFSLPAFVLEYFSEPEEMTTNYKSDIKKPLTDHIEELWDVLTRKPHETNDSLITLPHPYIVPGGRFREIYYWDSFFTMLGLQVSGRVDMIQNMVDNFSYLTNEIGYIPNGNRAYYIGRSQPPFFACMVQLLSEEKGKKILLDYLPQLEKEYNFWMKGIDQLNADNPAVNRVASLPDESILNHYWDEHDTPRPEAYQKEIKLSQPVTDKKILYRHLRAACESGWDFSSRWFKEENEFTSIHAGDIIPVDLNCLLLNLEQTIAQAYEFSGDKKSVEKFINLAVKRKDAINKYCWNEEKGFYLDYDYKASSQTRSFTLAATFSLYFKIASQQQADAVAIIIEKEFLKSGGLITTTETTDQQWDAPNGWAPLQWIAIMGLRNYNYDELAKEIARRWMSISEKVYHNTGKMMEKYNVVSTDLTAGGGEYESQDGFGWTNGVYLALKQLVDRLELFRS
ncbi:MAG TPA: alpha,alpha-trehalase TreF [Chitinophagaceae bacterium]|nr:alpha,alpha-trehalase TreF [Chitinophagaceae bacterium]